ncbi:Glycosyltransferase [Archaeoglobus fulgidus DSM 8774]|uniref:Glycosyltransferase n=1 Tax=Archaeoglobus fulgidus DSM 8774 TaxID=1344584 RepID=A0A075WIS4_ARCFL|nr:glycosyltransferase [Archaeoglobus fulgidus]AIG97478.1 Glycosyltransferase [Archaeoglobus fulgidus DSM 8774]
MGHKIIIISCPFPITGGGGRRSFEVLRRLPDHMEEDIEIVLPLDCVRAILRDEMDKTDKIIAELIDRGIEINEYSLQLLEKSAKFKQFKKDCKGLNISEFLRGTFSFEIYKKENSVYLKNCLKFVDTENVHCVYSHHECLDSALLSYLLAEKLRKNLVVLLQLEPFRPLNYLLRTKLKYTYYAPSIREIINTIPEIIFNAYTSRVYKKIVSSKFFKCFFSVSLAPVILSGLQNSSYSILNPANAFESELLKYRKNLKEKEDCAIFFARLSPEKGIFELPYIWKKVTNIFPDLKLIICGIPETRFLRKFENIAKKQGVSDKIILKGYVPRNELLEIVSRAKVFIYPTHSDSYSLVALESLALGTPVVTYDIPAIKYSYGEFDSVKIVPEWNINEMAKKVVEVIKMNEDDYQKMLNERQLLNFLKLHSSWENVAKAEARELEKVLNT